MAVEAGFDVKIKAMEARAAERRVAGRL